MSDAESDAPTKSPSDAPDDTEVTAREPAQVDPPAVEPEHEPVVVSTAPASKIWKRVWLALIALTAVLFLWNYSIVMAYRFLGASSDWALQGDQHQSIGHFWRYAVEGAIPPGLLLGDYSFAYHAPPLWHVIMAAASWMVGPLTAAKALGLLAYFLYALMAIVIVGRRTDWLLAFLVGMLVLRNPPDMPEQITGGMSRSMGPALLLLFLFAFMERRHKLALVTLVLQAGIYPAVVIPCGITYGAYCVLKGPMNARLRRCLGMFIAGVLVIVLGKAQDISAPEWWGSAVTYEQAEKMPAWGRGGRFPEVPHRSLESMMKHNIRRPYKDLGERPMPKAAVDFVAKNQISLLVVYPSLLALFAGGIAAFRRRKRGEPPLPEGTKPYFPWHFLALFVGSLAAYALVRFFSFKFFLPSRQIGFTVQYIIVVGLPLLVWWGAWSLWPRRRVVAVVLTALLTVAPAFAFRGNGQDRTAAGYRIHSAEIPMYERIRKLPFDEEIACDIRFCEFMMPMAQHVPYAARNLTHPLRKGFYDEAERRLVETHRVLYATSAKDIVEFHKKEGVRYFVYDTGRLRTRKHSGTFRPVSEKIARIHKAARGKPFLLANPPKETVVFRHKNHVLLDLSKFRIDDGTK